MKQMRKFYRKTAKALVSKRAAVGVALVVSPIGAAFAAADPTSDIVATIVSGKTMGVAAAVAFVVAVWAIRGVYMAQRKG